MNLDHNRFSDVQDICFIMMFYLNFCVCEHDFDGLDFLREICQSIGNLSSWCVLNCENYVSNNKIYTYKNQFWEYFWCVNTRSCKREIFASSTDGLSAYNIIKWNYNEKFVSN